MARNFVRRPALWVGLCVALCLSGAAPSRRSTPLPPGDAAPGPVPVRGGTLVYVQEPVGSLDPRTAADVYESTIVNQIHRGLLQFSSNLTPVPGVARTWTISRDGLEYVFELRPNVPFHHGRIMTADDVRYSFERIFEPGGELGIAGQSLTLIDGALAYHRGEARRIRGLEVLGPRTIRIRLSSPSGSFLWSLAMAQASIVPRDVLERQGAVAFARNPVGCGPFRLVTRTDGATRLAAFEEYYRGRAHLDSLVFLTPPTNATAVGVELLLEGRASMAEIPGYRRKELAGLSRLRMISGRELSLAFIGLNCRMPPLDNIHLRRALAHAVDRQAILRANPEGHIIPTGILPPGMSCYSPEQKLVPFNRDLARAELALAGYPDGRGLPPMRYVSSRSSTRSWVTDSMLVACWKQAGIPVKLEHVAWARLADGVDNRTISIFSLSWVADLPDPDSFMGSLFESHSTYNYFVYDDPEVDSLLQRGRALVDPRMRQGIYRTIEKRVLDHAAIIPLFNNTLAYAVQKPVHGIDLTPLGISYVDFAHAWVDGRTGDRADID